MRVISILWPLVHVPAFWGVVCSFLHGSLLFLALPGSHWSCCSLLEREIWDTQYQFSGTGFTAKQKHTLLVSQRPASFPSLPTLACTLKVKHLAKFVVAQNSKYFYLTFPLLWLVAFSVVWITYVSLNQESSTGIEVSGSAHTFSYCFIVVHGFWQGQKVPELFKMSCLKAPYLRIWIICKCPNRRPQCVQLLLFWPFS